MALYCNSKSCNCRKISKAAEQWISAVAVLLWIYFIFLITWGQTPYTFSFSEIAVHQRNDNTVRCSCLGLEIYKFPFSNIQFHYSGTGTCVSEFKTGIIVIVLCLHTSALIWWLDQWFQCHWGCWSECNAFGKNLVVHVFLHCDLDRRLCFQFDLYFHSSQSSVPYF